MFKASNIWCMSIINIIFLKHFDMFVVKATDDLRKLFVPWRTFLGIVLFFNGWLREIVFSSTNNLQDFFYSSTNLRLRKLWCMELDFLIFLILFIHGVCDKMSNRNIPNPNEQNRQLLSMGYSKTNGWWEMLLSM